MLMNQGIDKGKKAVVFGFDDVLFPQKDYLLQVYYLFANLLEYTETVPPAADLTAFLKTAYEHHGEAGLFDRAVDAFGIDSKYRENFDRLHETAQLPLKLLLYKSMLELMQELQATGKQLCILTAGSPVMQLNKLKHVEWHGLDRSLKVYFEEELQAKGMHPLDFVLADNKLGAADVCCVGIPQAILANGVAVDQIAADLFIHPAGS